MSPEDKANLDKTLEKELAQKWLPQPGPQTEAFFSDADLLLYGGAAGGGKSDLLCGLALTQHRRSVIFRRQSTDLEGFWDRLLEISPSNAKSDSNKKRLVTDDNRLIECGHLENPGSELSWQGRPHDFIGFDEGAQLTAYKVNFVLGWLRSADGLRCRAVIGSNPPIGGDGQWLVEWFAPWLDPAFPNPAEPGELRWAITVGDRSEIRTVWVDGPGKHVIDGYDLPPLIQHQHVVGVDYAPSLDTGLLFPMEARSLSERISARRDTVAERVEMAAKITPTDRPFVWWCNLNSEAEAIAKAIPGAVNLTGSDADDQKEMKIADFLSGKTRVLISKPSICGFGLNFQHCRDTGFVGLNDSFEQVFQAVRRFWRFGQTKPVNVHFIAAETEGAVVANLKRKEADAERMAASMVMHMADLSSATVRGMVRDRPNYNPTIPVILPQFLQVAS